MPSPPATQYSPNAMNTCVQENDQNAATACAWNHTRTRQVITLNLSYRGFVERDRDALHARSSGNTTVEIYRTEKREWRVSHFCNTSAEQASETEDTLGDAP